MLDAKKQTIKISSWSKLSLILSTINFINIFVFLWAIASPLKAFRLSLFHLKAIPLSPLGLLKLSYFYSILILLFSVLAIIFGIIALIKIKRNHSLKGTWMAREGIWMAITGITLGSLVLLLLKSCVCTIFG